MRRAFFVLVGVLLIAVACVWFFTPIGEQVVSDYAAPPPAPVASERSLSAGARTAAAPTPAVNMDMLNTVLNAINAVFGAVGIFLTLRGMRKAQ